MEGNKNIAGLVFRHCKVSILPLVATSLIIIFLIFGVAWGVAFAEKRNRTGDDTSTASANFEFGQADDYYVTGPDISKAIHTEEREFYVTAYCPPKTGYNKIQGGQTTSSGIHAGIGGVAVPPWEKADLSGDNLYNNYPWGTTFDIPGYGRGVAVDHGCAIQKANTPATCKSRKWKETPKDHLDIMVGTKLSDCNNWPTKIVKAKVYWFDQTEFNPRKPRDFIKSVIGGSIRVNGLANTGGTLISGTTAEKIVRIAQEEVDNSYQNDCTKYNSPQCYAWCAAFSTWVYKQAGVIDKIIAGTVQLREYTSKLQVISVNNDISKVHPGDIFWKRSDTASGWHVGIVEAIGNDGETVYTIEGNVGKKGNTDRVARRKQNISKIITVARPK